MEIKLTKEIEDFLDRCRYNIYNDTKNEFVGLHGSEHEVRAAGVEGDHHPVVMAVHIEQFGLDVGVSIYKDTNKRGQKQVYLLFAEREYLKDSAMEKERTVSNPDCGRPGKRSRHPKSVVTTPKIRKSRMDSKPNLPTDE